ncbi:hypothetical protein EDB89DRAFT_2068174 [Lactarius sanguifluus]|nr:hypothetical protein EDB89DRAFT_2068174 [Lactarius sanguifluus]
MATGNVWCLLIDEDHEPNFGEPFSVSIFRSDTIHELKVKILMTWNRHKLSHIPPNDLEIWKCKSLELSSTMSTVTRDVAANVQHLGVAQRMMEFSNLGDDEIWLVVVPQNDADFASVHGDTRSQGAVESMGRTNNGMANEPNGERKLELAWVVTQKPAPEASEDDVHERLDFPQTCPTGHLAGGKHPAMVHFVVSAVL